MHLLRSDGASLYWTTRGDGPGIVLSHGLFCDHRLLDEQAGALVMAGFRVVLWDLRGHGQSSRGESGVRFDDLVADLAAVVDASGLKRPLLVGQELGGVLSLALALDAPERLSGLSLWSVDAAPLPVADRATVALMTAARTVSVRPITLALEPLWIRRSDSHDAALAAMQRRCASAMSAGALVEVAHALQRRPEMRTRLREVHLPTQILWGERDRLIRPQAGRELLAAMPHAEGGPVPEAAHLLQIDQPHIVDELVVGFAQRVAARVS